MFAIALAVALTAAPNLAGRWEGQGFTLVLGGRGSGTISDGPMVPPEPITWRVSGNTLLITQDGDTIPYAMRLEKDSITLSSSVLERPVTLRRAGSASASQAPPPESTRAPHGGQETQGPPEGTCESACAHYVACAKQGQDVQNACLFQCAASGANPYQLAVYVQLDCQRAVAVVLAAQLQALKAAQGNQGQGRNRSSQCAGCVRDGNQCVWISQSNWGTGPNSPYSGAVSSCDPSCCR